MIIVLFDGNTSTALVVSDSQGETPNSDSGYNKP